MIEFEDTNAGMLIQVEISRLEVKIHELNQEASTEESLDMVDVINDEISHLNSVLSTIKELYSHTKEAYYETAATNTIRKWELGNYDK